MQHGHVADPHVFPNDSGKAPRAVLVAIAMDDGAVLDIGASADADMIHTRADDAIIPDARIRADLHIANNLATGGDKGARMDIRALAAKRQYQWVHDSRTEEHTSELQSLIRISYAVFCSQKKNQTIKYIH